MKSLKAKILCLALIAALLGPLSGQMYSDHLLTKARAVDAEAQNNLGVCYVIGEGVDQDLMEAVRWFRLAAEQRLPAALYSLGVCYEMGEGVAQDYKEVSNGAAWELSRGILVFPLFPEKVCVSLSAGVSKHHVLY